MVELGSPAKGWTVLTESAPPMPAVGWSVVYFVQGMNGLIKVGTSLNLADRLEQLYSGSAYPVRLLAWIDGGRDVECRIHIALHAHRHHGEWFRAHRAVAGLALIAAQHQGDPDAARDEVLRAANFDPAFLRQELRRLDGTLAVQTWRNKNGSRAGNRVTPECDPENEPSPRQAKVLGFVRMFLSKNGFPPTIREIGDALHIRSTNGVNEHLAALERKGWILRHSTTARGLTLTRPKNADFMRDALDLEPTRRDATVPHTPAPAHDGGAAKDGVA